MNRIAVLLIIVCLAFVGCASVQYGDFSYFRIGDQNIQMHIRTADGAEFDMIQFSDADALESAIKAVIEAMGFVK